jgi:hypothetical protein
MAAFGKSNSSEVDNLRNSINLLESRVSKLEEEIKNLGSKIESAAIPMVVYGKIAAPEMQPESEQIVGEEPDKHSASVVFFLSTPNSDGSFNNSSSNVTYKEGASIYKFQKTKDNQANFILDKRESSIRLAMRFPDKSIDPVCDSVNKFNPNPKDIITVEPGKAELIGDKWKVITKTKIRYEG